MGAGRSARRSLRGTPAPHVAAVALLQSRDGLPSLIFESQAGPVAGGVPEHHATEQEEAGPRCEDPACGWDPLDPCAVRETDGLAGEVTDASMTTTNRVGIAASMTEAVRLPTASLRDW
jgi:hypothetical protein